MKQSDVILRAMLSDRSKEWWYPVDFTGNGSSSFVGYEASARLSELAKKYPEMIISERDGRFMKRKIDWKNISEWVDKLPSSIKVIYKRKVNYETTEDEPKAVSWLND